MLDSPWHEARLCALLILVYRFQDRKAMPEEREAIFRFYLKNNFLSDIQTLTYEREVFHPYVLIYLMLHVGRDGGQI